MKHQRNGGHQPETTSTKAVHVCGKSTEMLDRRVPGPQILGYVRSAA